MITNPKVLEYLDIIFIILRNTSQTSRQILEMIDDGVSENNKNDNKS